MVREPVDGEAVTGEADGYGERVGRGTRKSTWRWRWPSLARHRRHRHKPDRAHREGRDDETAAGRVAGSSASGAGANAPSREARWRGTAKKGEPTAAEAATGS